MSSAASFAAQVARIPVAELDGPGLGQWDLRALVGHASRSLVTVDTYLEQPADEVVVGSAAEYYLAIAGALGAGDAAIVERGVAAGAALGGDPAAYVEDLRARVAEKLTSYDDSYLLTTIAGGMRLDEYLRTRTFELVVHGLDIAVASGVDPTFADGPLVDAGTLAAEVAALSGHGASLLLALTGRRSLPSGFSVV
ncbi:MAG: maleylpyruvate isomerase N-terminal domain-containing protein [Nocardioides sp.]